MDFVNLLAQADGAANPAEPAPGQSLWGIWPAILISIALYFLLIMRPERRKQAEYRARLNDLKKNDRVVTIGGIYGVVMNVQRDADEVTLKVDEATNAKIRVTFASIARVIGADATSENPA